MSQRRRQALQAKRSSGDSTYLPETGDSGVLQVSNDSILAQHTVLEKYEGNKQTKENRYR
ncbi:UNVERIFIED_CONTAM: hypothetical protein HHA_449340 [Hammondia hammondi]|eukprot:XP_008881989.1 hypothetical protein HHA_449340 [Hammondia hammondi]